MYLLFLSILHINMNKLNPQSSQLTKKGNTDLKRPPFVKQKEDAGLLETKNEVWSVSCRGVVMILSSGEADKLFYPYI